MDAGSKPPTMADVAARAGVSKALVSTVFRDVPGASAATRERVLKASEELGYRPNNRARMLRRTRTRLLGVMFRVADAFHSELVAALYPAVTDAGYDVVLGATTPDRPEQEALESLLDDRCEALLLVSHQSDDDIIERFGGFAPTVTLARRAPKVVNDVVRTLDAAVVKVGLDHLVGLGHSDIAMVDGGLIHGSADRRRAYRTSMTRRGLGQFARVFQGGNTELDGQSAARDIVGGGQIPSGVIVFNDRCAIGLVFELRALGLRVPEDVSVVGYDDIRLAGLPFIDLTTVGQDRAATARAAVARAVGRLDGGNPRGGETLIDPYFVSRGTTTRRLDRR